MLRGRAVQHYSGAHAAQLPYFKGRGSEHRGQLVVRKLCYVYFHSNTSATIFAGRFKFNFEPVPSGASGERQPFLSRKTVYFLVAKQRTFKREPGLRTPFALHTHSIHSNEPVAKLPVAEIAEKAFESGAFVWALTDHNTLRGHPEGRIAAEKHGLFFVPNATEISTYYLEKNQPRHMHFLVYFPEDLKPLADVMRKSKEKRVESFRNLAEELQNRLGLEINEEELENKIREGCLTKMDLARLATSGPANKAKLNELQKNKGITSLNLTKPSVFRSHVILATEPVMTEPMPRLTRHNVEATELIKAVRAAGGFVVLAHPRGHAPFSKDRLAFLAENGLIDGIEVAHPIHSEQELDFLEGFAAKHGLTPTVGSDIHNSGQRVSREALASAQRIANKIKELDGYTPLATKIIEGLREAEKMRK